MSNRTLIELNHDFCPRTESEEIAWARRIVAYMTTGNKNILPTGVTFKNFRHHSEPCPLEQPSSLRESTERTPEKCKECAAVRRGARWVGEPPKCNRHKKHTQPPRMR